MKLKRKLATIALAGGLAVTGMTATAPTAAAVGGCPAGKLCLYDDTNYAHLDVTISSTYACFDITRWGADGFSNGIGSYVNNLPVKADVYDWIGYNRYDGTIRPGGFSSDAGHLFGEMGTVCTGGARP